MNQRYVHVGSWNIEKFGNAGGRKENQYAISEHIQMAGVDVLALQEIYVTNKGEFRKDPDCQGRNSHLDLVIDLLKEQTKATWEYELFRNRSLNDTTQLCGIMWNSSRVKRKKTIRLDVETRAEARDGTKIRLWDRIPHAVKFSCGKGKLDFAVVALHMKSNVGRAQIVSQTRAHEAEQLVAALPQIERELGGERDIVMIGDTNCKNSREDAISTLASAGFIDLNADDSTTYYRGKTPFDRVFVPSNRPAFRFSRQYVLSPASPSEHDRYLSDHFVIKTVLKVLKDDDKLP